MLSYLDPAGAAGGGSVAGSSAGSRSGSIDAGNVNSPSEQELARSWFKGIRITDGALFPGVLDALIRFGTARLFELVLPWSVYHRCLHFPLKLCFVDC